jgi:lipid A disaccharide synthetase
VLLRSETEQLVGQKLMKALSNYKQLTLAPLSVKKSIVMCLVDAPSFHLHQRTKIKSQKIVVKVHYNKSGDL